MALLSKFIPQWHANQQPKSHDLSVLTTAPTTKCCGCARIEPSTYM